MRTDVLIKQPSIKAIHSLEPFMAIHAHMRVCVYGCCPYKGTMRLVS